MNDKKRPVGRPEIVEEKRKKKLITLRVTDAQYKLLESRAGELGLPISRYIRKVLKI